MRRREPAPTRLERITYNAVSALVIAAGLYQIVMWMGGLAGLPG
jgi:hypothetical protein